VLREILHQLSSGNRPPAAPVLQQGDGNWEIAMSTSRRSAPQHDKFISLEEESQIDYWTGKFSVTRDHLAMAIGRVGHSAEALEKYLKHG
jgi:hypothetical protein